MNRETSPTYFLLHQVVGNSGKINTQYISFGYKGFDHYFKNVDPILFSFLLEAECITVATPQRWHRALVINTHLKQKKTDINITLI